MGIIEDTTSIIEELDIDEIEGLVNSICKNDYEEGKASLLALLKNIYFDHPLYASMVIDNKTISMSIRFNKLKLLPKDNYMANRRESPFSFDHNSDEYYRLSKQILEEVPRKCYLAIVGNNWYKNYSNSEFVNAFVFTNGKYYNCDCINSTVLIRPFFSGSEYFRQGVILFLQPEVVGEKTQYLKYSGVLASAIISEVDNRIWNVEKQIFIDKIDKKYNSVENLSEEEKVDIIQGFNDAF